jgi:hypothetical protein
MVPAHSICRAAIRVWSLGVWCVALGTINELRAPPALEEYFSVKGVRQPCFSLYSNHQRLRTGARTRGEPFTEAPEPYVRFGIAHHARRTAAAIARRALLQRYRTGTRHHPKTGQLGSAARITSFCTTPSTRRRRMRKATIIRRISRIGALLHLKPCRGPSFARPSRNSQSPSIEEVSASPRC